MFMPDDLILCHQIVGSATEALHASKILRLYTAGIYMEYMEYIESTMETLVFDIFTHSKWLTPTTTKYYDFNGTLVCSIVVQKWNS